MADKVQAEEDVPASQDAAGNADNGKMSSKSSDISIEEIGPEEAAVEKADNAEVLVPEPEEPAPELEEIKPKEIIAPIEQIVRSDDEEEDDDDDDDDFEDETLVERLVGLTEMFPDGLTNAVTASVSGLKSGLIWAYGASRSVTWIVCTSASIMFLPVMIETERLSFDEAQKQQQRQILLGPGAAMSGGNAQANAPLPKAMS